MANVVSITLQGNDKLSSTIKNCESAMKNLSSTAKNAGSIQKEFDRITNSGKSLKNQLRQLSLLMANMNMKGLSNTREFDMIAQKAASIRDAISDADTAINKLSSDTRGLNAVIQGFTGLMGVASIATSSMALFGNENKDVQEKIMKVQAALGILNGVQSISNILNKDSALMLQLKATWHKISAAAASQETAATTANTISTTANTAATTASTIAQNGWNVAKAIAKALLGDVSGLLLVGVGALTTYALATSNSTKKQEENNSALKESKKYLDEYRSETISTFSKVISKYELLRSQYTKLRSDHEKTQWIKNNSSAFSDLGLSVKNVSDAENVFVSNSSAVVDSLMKRAKAVAAMSLMQKSYESYLKKVDSTNNSVKGGGYYVKQHKESRYGSSLKEAQNEEWRKANISYKDVSVKNLGGQKSYTLTQSGINKINALRQEQARQLKNTNLQQAEQELNKTKTIVENAIKESEVASSKIKQFNDTSNTNKTNTTHHKHTTDTNKNEVKYLTDSLADLEAKKSKIETSLKNGLIPSESIEKSIEEINVLKEKIQEKKYELGIDVKVNPNSIQGIEKQIQENQSKLKSQNLSDNDARTIINENKRLESVKKDLEIKYHIVNDPREELNKEFDRILSNTTKKQSSFEMAVSPKIDNSYEGQLSAIKEQMDLNDSLISQLTELKSKYEELNDVEGISNINQQLTALLETQSELGNNASNIETAKEQHQAYLDTIQNTQDVASSLGGALSSMGDAFSASGNKSGAAALKIMADTAKMVSTVVPLIMKLIGVKGAEAAASGTTSAAALPFPSNLIAIGTIVSTIFSTFASIKSSAGKFANGGIIGGNSFVGDQLIANVNSGEMILNGSQQRKLFDIVNGKHSISNSNQPQEITWSISGDQLIGVIKNYKKSNDLI